LNNANAISRRQVLKGMAAAATILPIRRVWAEDYHRANTDWFAACHFGVSTHWTADSQPVGEDDWLPFEEAVNHFDVERYASQIAAAGAQYVIFTSCHAKQMLGAPCAAIDRVAAGRTTKRDMIGDLADVCRAHKLRFILYYNHSCNHGDDAAWEHAVGYHAADKSALVRNETSIVRELGERYGSRVDGWYFDSCCSLDPRGVYDSVTTDLHGFQFPWEEFVVAAKAGYAERLVTLSQGMLWHFIYSTHQDYECGEANDLVAVPSSRFTVDHLQGHRWVCLDNPEWVHSQVMTPLVKPRFKRDMVLDYVSNCGKSQVPVTFNVDIDRTAAVSQESLALLHEVSQRL
jgi:hypothetical protein